MNTDENNKSQKQKTITAQQKNQKILELLGGISSGSAKLSENYKEYLHAAWKQKHGIDL